MESLTDEEWETLCCEPDDPREFVSENANGDKQWRFERFLSRFDEHERSEQTHILLLPTPVPWEVFAWYPTGGWNGAPNAEEQLSMIRHWNKYYGIEPVVDGGDWYELYAPRLPKTRKETLVLAREMTGFGEVTILNYGELDIEDMIDILQTTHRWYFWRD